MPVLGGATQNLNRVSSDPTPTPEVYESLAYSYDGTLEGLLSAVFAAYAQNQDPQDLLCGHGAQTRLGQIVSTIPTDINHAERVHQGIVRACGDQGFTLVKQAFLSDKPEAGTAIYRYIRHAMDQDSHRPCAFCAKRSSCSGFQDHVHGSKRRNFTPCPRVQHALRSDLTHPDIAPVYLLAKSVRTEQEHMLQFIRFEHLEGGIWFARCNPKASVLPLIMDHFSSRLNTQAFIILDETHHLAGVYEGREWYLVPMDKVADPSLPLPDPSADEALMQHAWKRFYHTIAVESRYNPELRRHFMPKRLWRHITEMQEELP